MSEQRWIIHLPTVITARSEALELAAALHKSLGHVGVIDFTEIALSEEHRQLLRHRLYCRLPVKGGGDCCVLRDGHSGVCSAQAPAEQ
jgi:hypothetical protein